MDRNTHNFQREAINRQAAKWFYKMSDKTVSDGLRHDFEQWRNEHTAHDQAYGEYQSVWGNRNFERALKEFSCQKSSYQKTATSTPKKLFTNWSVAVAMAAALLIIPMLLFFVQGYSVLIQAQVYQTGVGQQQTVTLEDGTVIMLNTDTELQSMFNGESRQIILTRGQAYFDVAKDTRPFQVRGGSGVVSVLGTAFDVQITSGNYSQMLVTVERGLVAVSSEGVPTLRREISAHQKIAVVDNKLGYASQVSGEIADWRDGWLEFNSHSLPYVIEELDRYYPGDIQLGNAELKWLRVTGRFNLASVERAVDALAKSLNLEIEDNGAGRLVLKESP